MGHLLDWKYKIMGPIEQSLSRVDLGFKGPNDPFECKLFLAKIVYVHMKLKNNARE